ncbi:sensor histidine kinase [Vulgatibacter sp.]|uniref:sensor histidine kinase n=1 Tax=Vulgatibacter sp. TaxID=1971226 RepID=UPI003563C83D
MKRGTFWRVYLHGLLLLLLVALAIFAVGKAFGRPPHQPERFAGWLAASHAPYLHDRAALQRELDATFETFGIDIAIYARDGTRLAAAGEDPPALPPHHRGPMRPRHLRKADLLVAPIGRPPEAFLVARRPRWSGDLTRPAAILGAVLAALALGSIPLARSIASPLERLTGTVRRFGGGDLSARTGLARGRRRGSEVIQLAAAFDEMADRIETLIRSEKELLANVSHELRTPLARIRIALELAEEGDTRGGRYLREIETDLAELEAMIGDVLTVARLDLTAAAGAAPSGTPPLRRAPCSGDALVEAAAERFRALHPDRHLDVEITQPLPAIDCDAALVRRALANLLDNAVKYSDEAILLRALPREGNLVVEVIDRGIGIEPEDLPRLFTPFFRTDRSRARGTGGVGLGLLLARRIVEAHGGNLAVQSEPNRGTTFRLTLPA